MAIYSKFLDSWTQGSKGYTKVQLSDGTVKTFTGSRGYRNNNPGNLTNPNSLAYYSKFGAIAADYGGNLVFATMQGGFNAQKDLVFGKFGNRTIERMLYDDYTKDADAYAPIGADNDPNGTNKTYLENLEARGWDKDTLLSDLTPEQQNKLLADMIRVENTTEDANKILEQIDPESVSNEAGSSFIQNEPEGEDTVSVKSGEGTAGTSAARNDAIAPASGGDFGFKDPDKTFSVEEYKDNQKTSVAARGEWQPKLKLPDGQPFEVPQDAQPEYPHNKVIESTNPNPEERHRMEIDDTPSEPRVTLVHKIGTGVEMMEKDGLMVVNSSGRMVQLVGDDFEMFVAGNGTVIYKGNLDWTVEGDMNLTVKGNMKTTVEGTKTEVVKKSVIEEYQDDQETTVTNNKSTTVGETSTETILGDKNTFVKKKQSNWVNGNIEFLSGDNTHISSQKTLSMAATNNINAASGAVFSATSTVVNLDGALSLDITSPTMTINANNLDIFSATTLDISTTTGNWHAAAGTLGGPGVYHYGAAWDGTLNVIGGINAEGNVVLDQTLEVGGNAELGGTLDVASNTVLGGTLNAGEIVSSGDITAFGTAGTATTPASTNITDNSNFYVEPTNNNITNTLSPLSITLPAVASTLTTTLTASEEGIMQVSVDPGNKIKQTIDIRERIKLGLGLE